MNRSSGKLEVEYCPLASLTPYAGNPRTHSPTQIRQIAASIKQFGFTLPILVDAQKVVIAGHARILAARLLGIESVPTIRLGHLSESQKRGYIIADNKLAENAGWDRELLAAELRYLSELDLDFDVSVVGFEAAEIDLLLQAPGQTEAEAEADQLPAIDVTQPSVSRRGDLWVLDRHRLLCADAREEQSFSRLLGRKKAQIVFTDPPYNIPIDGHVCGSGLIKHRDFAMAVGEMSEAEYTEFLRIAFRHLVKHSIGGSLHYVFMHWRQMYPILSAARGIYSELKNLCVWAKTNGGMGSLYRSSHELVFVFKNGTAAHINNVELGRFGRNRSNLWTYPGVNTFREGRLEDLAMHPTVKPVALVSDAILDCSKRGGIVLDCFGGSGATMIASEKTGRRGYLIELDPVYVDVTIRRFQKLTGKNAIHEEIGRTFADIESEGARRLDSCVPIEREQKEQDGV